LAVWALVALPMGVLSWVVALSILDGVGHPDAVR
jgi:hypothetical protein